MIVKLVKKLLDKIIIYAVRRFVQEYQASSGFDMLHHKIQDKVLDDCADFVLNNLENAMLFRSEREIQEFAIARVKDKGLLMEFGVASGETINFFSNQLAGRDDKRLIYGFDSFEGLREDYTGSSLTVGAISQGGKMPRVGSNVRLVKGWIQDTLGPFLDEHDGNIAFIHVDTDTYETGLYLLNLCKKRLGPDTLILFDQLLGGPNWRNHEYKALIEAFSDDEYEFIAFATKRALIRLKG